MLKIQQVFKRFPLKAGLFAAVGDWVYAINGVSFQVAPNEIYGLVGESGSGKSTMARMIVNVHQPDRGSISYRNSQGKLLTQAALRQHIQYIFQDPAHSLNPKLSVFSILTAGYRYRKGWPGRKVAEGEVAETLYTVGLRADDMWRRPNDFSGGQRQRIAIARALIERPTLLICDEVVSALDVSIQAQIINMLLELKARYKLSLLFISHDLALVGYLCDRIGVLHRGLLVEEAPAQSILHQRWHPYSEKLYSAVPARQRRKRPGQLPKAISVSAREGWSNTVENRYWREAEPRYRQVATNHYVLEDRLLGELSRES